MFIQGHVLVAGAGVSGAGCARMLVDLGVEVTVADNDETARFRVGEATGAATIAPAEVDWANYSYVVTSPGWRPDTPLLLDAAANNIPVIGDVELAWRLDRDGAFGKPHTWMVVTGTNGKTTTTAMLAEMMKRGPKTAAAVGNIGVAVGDALTASPRIDILVAELSSFQLHWSEELTPDVGCVLNLAHDHIDWHGSFDAYAEAKMKALRGVAIIGIDDLEVARRAGNAIGFTLGVPAQGQVGVQDGYIIDRAFGGGVIAPIEGISPPGPAGILDALAATAMARSQGIEPTAIAEALANFQVSGHRGQVVYSADGVSYIDNSKATNPHAADAALEGHDSVVWIAGGQLKGADIRPLLEKHAHRLKAALLLGVDRHTIANELATIDPTIPVVITDSLSPNDAMRELVAAARNIVAPGDVVLLAPAAASLDMFSGMSQRGNLFAQAAAGSAE
ncbi:UDP-N-acetylmuramoyl-L-alanine--D-glutamate ligase [Corynebacterium freiburgense]|uniref:UDP-N-acetylmuramoyl-L-alanine--D-glutamate ligase n=1 Tax=Corynebacterium freiburgense TaxID=556548 RepID=UPI000424E2EE|nr:UDP-N-acetylmuramoyl-L-alanine--D-glutamate ligase [Corynebacterium freiburgense]WJZ03159.1 UDP-N-acetylmuramoylalanine--D-glutamate ligase [Corynebacterium freiburgense]